MAFRMNVSYIRGRLLRFQIRQLVAGVEGDYWDNTNSTWTITPSSSNELVPMVETIGFYDGATNSDLSTYTGKVMVRVYDTTSTPTVGIFVETYDITGGVEKFVDDEIDAKLDAFVQLDSRVNTGLEQNVSQTVLVYVVDSNGTPSTAAVSATTIATVAASPSFSATTNAAVYAGTPGFYSVLLTAAECNRTAAIVRVALSGGASGDLLLSFGKRTIETELADGGRIDTLIDSIVTKADSIIATAATIQTSTGTTIPGLINTVDTVVDTMLPLVHAVNATTINGGALYELVEAISVVGGGGDATIANQSLILGAISTLQTTMATSFAPVNASLAALTSSVNTVNNGVIAANSTLEEILLDTSVMDVSMKAGGTIYTLISNVSGGGGGSPISAREVSKSRTWVVDEEGVEARNTITLTSADSVTVAMEFHEVLNPQTTITSVTSVLETQEQITATSITIAQDRQTVHFNITGLVSLSEYRFRVTAVTTDGQTISGEGVAKIR